MTVAQILAALATGPISGTEQTMKAGEGAALRARRKKARQQHIQRWLSEIR